MKKGGGPQQTLKKASATDQEIIQNVLDVLILKKPRKTINEVAQEAEIQEWLEVDLRGEEEDDDDDDDNDDQHGPPPTRRSNFLGCSAFFSINSSASN